MIILGAKEVENATVSVRRHRKGDVGVFSQEEFITSLLNEIKEKHLPED